MPSAAASLSIPDLAGKVVLVTGGSTGIGAALVEGLCRAGLLASALHYNASHDVAAAGLLPSRAA